ncbi:uncharacterized protein LOC125016657 isoform X2 [Mugil cephalus]|uniref:uncharacterized protein LOC125016657 isoform X2 n=1 Tax=Mugil cephalus TaxID=48193 RepID=UPI001FB76DFE|nr:uncharacterized protein LOC125016657 isoform X2 [Mugil cephalus]
MFTPAETAFLTDYTKTMSPVAKAVNALQGEANVQLGWLLPTIILLTSNLHNLHTTSKYCGPLVNALLAGLERCLGEMLAEPELITAAILVPKFRTCWTSDEGIIKCGLNYIKTHLKEQSSAGQSGDSVSVSSSEEDFFSTIKQTDQQDGNTKQLESILASATDTMDILKTFPSVCHLSLKLNTPLPA